MKAQVTVKNRRRIAIGFSLIALLLILLLFRVAWIQIVDAEELTDKAIAQQTQDTPIEAKRGTIYDRNGKELATSTTCYTLWARPSQIKLKDGKERPEAEIKEFAAEIASVTDGDSGKIYENLTKEQALVKIAKYLDKESADAIKALSITGLELTEDNKRYYPLGNFASQLLGSVNDDNQGRTGIELQYDQYLAGISGRWVKNTDLLGNELVEGAEEYYEAQDGLNVIMTLDEAIQYYVEKALEKGMEKTKAERIMCLVMDPKTGDILASASTPGFDPNDATEPLEKDTNKYEKMSTEEKNRYLFKLWRNPLVSDTYEPGSTFKLITSSSAIEEKVIDDNTSFNCSGSFTVSGVRLHCWTHGAHPVSYHI